MENARSPCLPLSPQGKALGSSGNANPSVSSETVELDCGHWGLGLMVESFRISVNSEDTMQCMDEHQERFLRDEFFSLTLMATVQRAKVYVAGASDDRKWSFQKALRSSLQHLEPEYRAPVSEEVHIANILALADGLSRDFGDVLAGGRFRIGTAQKALNLYLKYLWCIGKLPPPPHCPFDFRVITKLPKCQGISWTALDDPAVYRKLVSAAKVRSAGGSIALWELKTYNDLFTPSGAQIKA
jgi:hypothetical protein